MNLKILRASRSIAESIESILNQTFRRWELVIVDDASTDNSIEIINRYLEDPRIKLLEHDKNQGVSRAALTGIANISADVFGMVDSDDLLLPNALEYMNQAHQQQPECGFIYSQHVLCDSLMNPVKDGFCAEIPKGKTTLQADVVSAFRTFKLRDYLKTPMHDPDLNSAEDKDIINIKGRC